MTTYRILLVITAVSSALITALFINPVNSNSFVDPLQNVMSRLLMQAPERSNNQVIENVDPLTLAMRVCTQTHCEDLSLAEMEYLSGTRAGTENKHYQTSVPFHLPQQGVPIIEM